MLMLPRNATIIVAVALVATLLSAFGADADVTVPPKVRALMLRMPRPTYPYEAYARRITGRGMCEIDMDSATGVVTRVVVVQSTRSRLLDEAAVKAFSQWRARPDKISRIRVPFTFTFAAASGGSAPSR
jgi:TonB family protein